LEETIHTLYVGIVVRTSNTLFVYYKGEFSATNYLKNNKGLANHCPQGNG